MKRLLSLVIAAILFLNVIPFQAMAADNSVELNPRALSYIDLSSISSQFQFNCTINARATNWPLYRFYTDSTVIKLYILANRETSVRVYFYGPDPYNLIADPSAVVNSTNYKILTLNNLVQGVAYYFAIENLGDTSVNLTCLVGD